MTLNKDKFSIFVFLVFMVVISSCSKKSTGYIILNGKKMVSITSYGAKGDGEVDNVDAIQNALNAEEAIFVPKGRYLLGHPQYDGIHNPFLLYISSVSKCRELFFENGAEWYVKDNFGKVGEKYSVLLVVTDNGNIEKVNISGITINSNKSTQLSSILGVNAIESKFNIKELKISDAKITNLTGGGINSFALRNNFKNIYTENLGSHGIGFVNPYNLGQEHYVDIDGYTSINDQAYSIDFSGVSVGEGYKYADPNDTWTGKVKNVISKFSKNGIKTAGHWNLELENIYIEGSKNNGFFLSKDAPGRTVTVNKMTVKDCKGSGIFLVGVSSFVGNDIDITNCNSGFYVDNTKVKVDGLTVDGQNKNAIGIRVQGGVEISNFKVTGLLADYPVWITGTNVTFKNGEIYNNEGPYSFLVHELAENVFLENINFYDDREVKKQIYGYMILQKKGKLTIRNNNRTDKLLIENRTGIEIRN